MTILENFLTTGVFAFMIIFVRFGTALMMTLAASASYIAVPAAMRVALPDIAALEKFILEQLTPISGIEKIRSSFALKQVRYKTALPLPVA
mgnify:CR=1 FL=1